jgi:hypothetical protein
MTSLINDLMFNAETFNGPAIPSPIPSYANVLFNQTSIQLDWAQVPAASNYRVQVSLFPDFRTNFIDDSTLVVSQHTFTDSQVNNAKRYWRWQPLLAPGPVAVEPWSEIGSYWLDTGAAEEITLPRDVWAIFDADDVTDYYELELFPIYTIVPANLYRAQERNRLGELLSEFLTVKNEIALSFTGQQYVTHGMLNEFRRFHNTLRTFYLATYKDGEWHRPMPNIWRVQFTQDPMMSMIAAGRGDLVAGNLTMTEV